MTSELTAKANRVWWLVVLTLIVARLVLTAGLSLQPHHAPHDDSLYVERAAYLLEGEGFGPYNSRTLVKYPGMSVWIAAMHWLGIPFMWSITALYVAASAYLAAALLGAGAGAVVAGMVAAFCLFNPVTFGSEWWRVMREPLDTSLLLAMFAAITYIVANAARGRVAWTHWVIFSAAFAFSMWLREENRLLWLLIALLAIALVHRLVLLQARVTTALGLLAVLLVPAGLAKGYEYALRHLVQGHYGLPIVHDMSEGEYPRLLASIRSIQSTKDNRLVMVTQDRLQKLRQAAPAFTPVSERLPAPGPDTFSCHLQGVCTEWSNGWMPFWIKDEAFAAGLTPTLPAGQAYFRGVRAAIEAACEKGQLACRDDGRGFLPPMELRWIRAYVNELYRVVRMSLTPDIDSPAAVPYSRPPPRIMALYYRVLLTPADEMLPPQRGRLGSVRENLVRAYLAAGGCILALAAVAFAVRLWLLHRVPASLLTVIATIAAVYTITRLLALSYVAVFLGPFTGRIVFSTYTLSMALAAVVIADAALAWRTARR